MTGALVRNLGYVSACLGGIMKSLLIATGLMISNFSTALAVECRISATPGALEQVLTTQNLVILDRLSYKPENAETLPLRRLQQILKMVEQTQGQNPFEILTALKVFNDRTILRYDFTSQVSLPAEFYSVIYGYRGSEQVGVIFEGASLKIVAEVKADKILICDPSYN